LLPDGRKGVKIDAFSSAEQQSSVKIEPPAPIRADGVVRLLTVHLPRAETDHRHVGTIAHAHHRNLVHNVNPYLGAASSAGEVAD